MRCSKLLSTFAAVALVAFFTACSDDEGGSSGGGTDTGAAGQDTGGGGTTDTGGPGTDTGGATGGTDTSTGRPDVDRSGPCPGVPDRCFTPTASLPVGFSEGVAFLKINWLDDEVTLQRRPTGGSTTLSGFSLCANPDYASLPDITLNSNETVTLHLTDTGTNTATDVFLGDAFGGGGLDLEPMGELALFATQDTNSFGSDNIWTFVAWGEPATAPTRVNEAVAGDAWETASEFVQVCDEAIGITGVGTIDWGGGYRAQPAECDAWDD